MPTWSSESLGKAPVTSSVSSTATGAASLEAITDDEIRLVYEPLQQRTVIRIPAASPSP